MPIGCGEEHATLELQEQQLHGAVQCPNCRAASQADDTEPSLVEEVLDAMGEAAVITHGNRILHINREFTRVFGYSLLECSGQDLDELVVPEGLMHEQEVILHTLEAQGRVAIETRRRGRSGAELDVCVLIARLRLGGQAQGMLVTYRDIRRQKEESARLTYSARHDGLTGLPNRALFLDQVGLTLDRLRRRPDRRFAVIFLDLDGFKQVNDQLGHAAGDALLLVVAARLQRYLRPQDTVARFGGDEFALLLDEIGCEAEVEAVAGRLQREIQLPVDLNGSQARVAASIGIAIAVPGCKTAEDLLMCADAAMYGAKTAGGASHVTHRWESCRA
jgi:diguanylate cyclase (GGDEF)-like protein/PAS domain S-box-containing protein